MARLILVRHGHTDWNQQMRYQGQTDIALNEKGIEQSRRAARRLAAEKIDTIYSSDLKRALHTARIIAAEHGMQEAVHETPVLREMNFGELEGLRFDEIDEKYRLIFSADASWRNAGPNIRVPGGESISDMSSRIERFISELSRHRQNETVLVVSHGGPLQVLTCLLLEVGIEHWWQLRFSAASISVIENHPSGASLTFLNSTSHLDG
ncbi:MAG: alpha-ribazole phosphatase [Dehalococcoidia bacterium]